MKCQLKGPPSTELPAKEFAKLIGETYSAIAMYIDDNTDRELLITLEQPNSIYINISDNLLKDDLSNPHSCYWLRVTDHKPEYLLLIGLEQICQKVNLPTQGELADPNFFHWLKKICTTLNIIGDKIDQMTKTGFLHLNEPDTTAPTPDFETQRENNHQLSRAKVEIAANIDFQHQLDLLDLGPPPPPY